MKAPDKIFLEKERETNKISHLWGVQPVLHSGYEHIEYIRKDALLEWSKAEIELSQQVELVSEEPYEEGRQQVARLLINYLNSM